MNGPRALVRRLLASFRGRRIDRELRDEIQAHLDEATDDYVRRGMTPADAHLAALRNFGGVAQTEEIHREIRAFGWLHDLQQDLRYTARVFARNPAFTIVAVLTLALGIGATTTIVSLLDAVVFKPLPVPAPGELVTFFENEPGGTPDPAGGTGRYLRFSYDQFERLQRALGAQGSIAAVTRSSRLIARPPGRTERTFVRAQFVSGGYFATLGVPAARGRILTDDDVRLDHAVPVAVVSDGFWRRWLGADDAALGRTIAVNEVAVTIVGIAPRGFVGLWTDAEADVWFPLSVQQTLRYQNNSSTYGPVDTDKPWMTQPIAWLNLVARLPRGNARAVLPRLQAVDREAVQDLASTMTNPKGRELMLARTLAVEPLSHGFSGLRARFSDALFVLTGMVVLVLIVTCANIANLLLARAAARAQDMRLRIALGATTWRLIRQCLTESVALAALGGTGGVLLSRWGSTALARQVINSSSALPTVFGLDRRVLAFAVAISIAAAIVFGLVPAVRAIAAGRRAAAGGHQRQAIGSTLPGMRGIVVAQLALSVVLVSAALLFGRTLVGFLHVDPGFAVDRLVTVTFDPISSGYAAADVPALARRLRAATQSIPGVAASAASMCGLIENCTSSGGFSVEGVVTDPNVSLFRNWISPGYFGTVGIPLVAGREFTERDTAASPRVAIVNESIARKYFPGQDPIGKRLGDSGGALDIEIVGVARDARTQTLHDPPAPLVYRPIEQKPAGQQPPVGNLDVRVMDSAASIEPALRQALRAAEPRLLIGDVGPMSRRLSRDLTRERVVAYLAFGFGGVTLLLAGLGLYGVLSYGVTRRTQEIGIRMALGARRVEVLALVAGQSARLALVGLALGLLATWGVARYFSETIYGAAPLDRTTLALVSLVFVVVALAASYLPGRRATNVDPLIALRCE